MTGQIMRVDEFRPDYSQVCAACGAGHVVTGYTNGKQVYQAESCGACTWGDAKMIDPDNWQA